MFDIMRFALGDRSDTIVAELEVFALEASVHSAVNMTVATIAGVGRAEEWIDGDRSGVGEGVDGRSLPV